MPYNENDYINLQIGGKNLNIYGNANATDNANVNLWDKTSSNDQIFKIKFSKDKNKNIKGAYLLSSINERYGLNIFTKNNNCDIYPIKNNLNDSLLDFKTIDREKNIYKVKLVHHELYLTAQNTEKNSNVSWSEYDETSDLQTWKFVPAKPKVTNASKANASSANASNSNGYVWPTVSKRITQYFTSVHRGVDVGGVNAGISGDDLYAFCDGTVVRVFNWTQANGTSGNASMGNAIFIHSLNPKPELGGKYLRTIYMHLQQPTPLRVGDKVKAGDFIGKMGNTGYSFGTHLHFGMQVHNSKFNPVGGSTFYIHDYFVNPLSYF